MSRPKTAIDWEKVNEYLKAQCSKTSIAEVLGINVETLYRRCKEEFNIGFDAYSQQKRSEGKEALRKLQYDTAFGKVNEKYIEKLKDTIYICEPNTTMMIWLGKQYLEQSDKVEAKNQNTNIEIDIKDKDEVSKRLKDVLLNELKENKDIA